MYYPCRESKGRGQEDKLVTALHFDRKSLCFLLAILFSVSTAAQQQERPDYSKLFDKTEVMIAARDGVKLHTEIYSPKNASEPLPVIFERTPYGLSDDNKGYSRILNRYVFNCQNPGIDAQRRA